MVEAENQLWKFVDFHRCTVAKMGTYAHMHMHAHKLTHIHK